MQFVMYIMLKKLRHQKSVDFMRVKFNIVSGEGKTHTALTEKTEDIVRSMKRIKHKTKHKQGTLAPVTGK